MVSGCSGAGGLRVRQADSLRAQLAAMRPRPAPWAGTPCMLVKAARSSAVPHGPRHQESRALPQSRPCPQPPPLPGAAPGTVGAPGVGLWIRWGCAPPLPEMHQCPVLPPQRLDVEPVCTHQDVALLEDREPSGLPALPPVQGSASLGRHRTRHGLALGLSQGSSPSPRPKSPSVGAQRGTHALWGCTH